jgi:protein-disulfide isomerase
VAELRSALNNLLNPPEPVADHPPTTRISIAGLATRGQPNAPVTMVVFADFQSQLSARFLLETFPKIDEYFVQSGTVRYVFKNFPDLTAHPQAFKAHEAAACAGDQGRYWEMHDLLFANQTALAPDQLIDYAASLEVDTDLFRYCLTSGAHRGTIRRDVDEGQTGGVTLTPVFAIGLTEPNSESMEVMEVVIGVQPYATFEEAVEAVLEGATIDR